MPTDEALRFSRTLRRYIIIPCSLTSQSFSLSLARAPSKPTVQLSAGGGDRYMCHRQYPPPPLAYLYAASARGRCARTHTDPQIAGTRRGRGGATICRRSRRCGPAIRRRRYNNRGTAVTRRRMLIQRRDALRATAWSLSGRTTTTTTMVLICDRRGSNNIIRTRWLYI